MKLERRHKVVTGFVLALALLGVVELFHFLQVGQLQETAALVARTHEVQAHLNLLMSMVQDVETGDRGFLVTGEPVFLGPFYDGLNAIAEQQRRLNQLTLDGEQKASLSALESVIAERLAVSRRNVELRRNAGFEAARQAVASGEGRAMMEQVRLQVAQMGAREQVLLEQRSAAAGRGASLAARLGMVSAGVGVALLLATFAFVLSENQRRQRAEQFLDRFFTLSLDMLCIADMDGYFKRLSPAFTQTLGWTTDELRARPFLDFVHPDDRAETLAEVEKLSRGVPTVRFENRYQCQDGSWRWLSWKAQPVVEEGLLYATARDTTDRKRAEELVSQLNADLQGRAVLLAQANEELESFSYSVSHDLRAPLRHVHGYVEMLQRATDGQLSDKAQRYLKTISDASLEMGQLIDDLLAFSRMGRAEIKESLADLSALVQDTIRGLERATTGRTIIWQVAPLPTVVGDPSLLKQVLANLVGNAVKYSRLRDPATIEIGCAGEEDGRVILFVRDNGAGFDMQYGHKLFGVFQRLHRAEEFEGTGIGLAIVRRIVARHGGRVWAEGAVNQGATFYFTLKRPPSA